MKLLIDTNWFASLKDLSPKKRHEVLEAILDYPNKESDTYLWKNVIKPDLERGSIAYYNKLNNLKQNNPQKSAKKITDTDTESDTESDTGTESNINIINTRGISNKGVIGGKEIKGMFIPPTMEEVLEYARRMNDEHNFGTGGFACGKQTAVDFFNQYDRQGWLLGNGNHMTNWKSGLRRWADEQKKKLLEQ